MESTFVIIGFMVFLAIVVMAAGAVEYLIERIRGNKRSER